MKNIQSYDEVLTEAPMQLPKGLLSGGGMEDKKVKQEFKKYTKYAGDEFTKLLKGLQSKYGRKGVFFKTLKSKDTLYSNSGYFAMYFDKPFEFILAKDGYGNTVIFTKDPAPKEFIK